MNKNMKPWVVCVEPQIVLFGYATQAEINKESPVLTNARMCVYWAASVKGVMGLAVEGPNTSCRISPSVGKHHIRTKVECVMECSEEAAAAWEKEPWG